MSIETRDTPAGRRYLVRWTEAGRKRSRTFDRKGDAQAWEAEVRRRQQLGALAVAQLTERGPTLGEWVADRWTPEHAANLAARTLHRYAQIYGTHLAPWLEDLPIRDLTVPVLRQWQADRLQAGVSVGEIRRARVLLSSVLRHAAESEAIPANPLSLVRAPKAPQRDEVRPIPLATVEQIRRVLAEPMPTRVPEGRRSGARRRAYDMPDTRTGPERVRDALLVSVLAYAGTRPSEALALKWSDVQERTLLVQRATDSDGSLKSTKGRNTRTVRLLAPLRSDFLAYRLAAARPPESALIFERPDGTAWTATDLGNWRRRRWVAACDRANVEPRPRLYDLRHGYASILLASRKSVHYVARQLGNSPALVLSTYGHVVDEYAEAGTIDVENEIATARGGPLTSHSTDAATG